MSSVEVSNHSLVRANCVIGNLPLRTICQLFGWKATLLVEELLEVNYRTKAWHPSWGLPLQENINNSPSYHFYLFDLKGSFILHAFEIVHFFFASHVSASLNFIQHFTCNLLKRKAGGSLRAGHRAIGRLWTRLSHQFGRLFWSSPLTFFHKKN